MLPSLILPEINNELLLLRLYLFRPAIHDTVTGTELLIVSFVILTTSIVQLSLIEWSSSALV